MAVGDLIAGWAGEAWVGEAWVCEGWLCEDRVGESKASVSLGESVLVPMA